MGIFGLAPIIAVVLGIGALIYYLIGDIDRDRETDGDGKPGNLSSAVRVFVLRNKKT